MVPRVHHDEIVKAAATGATITVLVDLQPKDPFLILGIMRNVAYGEEEERVGAPARASRALFARVYCVSRVPRDGL